MTFKLIDKVWKHHIPEGDCISVKEVKEFIRLLKEEWSNCNFHEDFRVKIDNLSGFSDDEVKQND